MIFERSNTVPLIKEITEAIGLGCNRKIREAKTFELDNSLNMSVNRSRDFSHIAD